MSSKIDVKHHTIGELQVTRVEEMCHRVSPPHDWYLDYNAEELRPHLDWLTPRFYDRTADRPISCIHSWVLKTPNHTILVDSCTGNQKSRPDFPMFDMLNTPYLERLSEAGVKPEDIDVVLCTHLHVDHVGWNTKLDNGRWVPTFPNARYLMSRVDNEYYAAAASDPATKPLTRHTYNDSVLPVIECCMAHFVEGAEEIGPGLVLRPSPGHTPGHVCLDVNSKGRRALFCGDVLHHPLQIPLWHWRTRVCYDPDQARDTRREVLEYCAENDVLLLPQHFASPHGAYVKSSAGTFMPDFTRF